MLSTQATPSGFAVFLFRILRALDSLCFRRPVHYTFLRTSSPVVLRVLCFLLSIPMVQFVSILVRSSVLSLVRWPFSHAFSGTSHGYIHLLSLEYFLWRSSKQFPFLLLEYLIRIRLLIFPLTARLLMASLLGHIYTSPDKFLHGQKLARFHLEFTWDRRNWTNF